MSPNREEDTQALSLAHLLSALQVCVDLSLGQLLALLHIALEPGLSVNELGERIGCPQQTASRHVAALLGRYQLEMGDRAKLDPLIVQEISQADPRRRALFLSDQGKALLKTMVVKLDGNDHELIRGVKK